MHNEVCIMQFFCKEVTFISGALHTERIIPNTYTFKLTCIIAKRQPVI